jgi:uncharacterized protein YraI
MITKFWLRSLVATLAFTASAAAALAAPALVTRTTPLLSSPDYRAQYLDTIYQGQKVHVQQCYSRWCSVVFQGEDGWVSRNRLSFVPQQPRYPDYPDYPRYPRYSDHPRYGDRPGAGVYVGPGGGMSFGFSAY